MEKTYQQPKVGDIILGKDGRYHKVLMYCRYVEAEETLVIYEDVISKNVNAIQVTPINQFRKAFEIAIKAEHL